MKCPIGGCCLDVVMLYLCVVVLWCCVECLSSMYCVCCYYAWICVYCLCILVVFFH